MISVCWIIYLVISFVSVLGCTFLPDNQYEALKAIYNSTDGPLWSYGHTINSSFVPWSFGNETISNSPCTDYWEGITCSCDDSDDLNSNGQYNIRNLTLTGFGLSGSIPSALGYLTGLKYLYLSNNLRLRGSIPESIGNLSYLQILDISLTLCGGSIPSTIVNLRSMEKLSLNENNISGTIPFNIGDLGMLTHLNLEYNSLTGTIPPSLMNLKFLQDLELSFNNLTGTLPSEMIDLPNINILSLNNNNINGTIPDSVCRLTTLLYFRIGYNPLIGTIPECLSNLTNLYYINIALANLSGTIPESLSSLSSLRQLTLHTNNLIGTIPASLGSISTLKYLDLESNNLTGAIPSTIFGSERSVINSLYLNNNNLSGTIPNNICNSTGIQYLYLSSNRLVGAIPGCIGELLELRKLGLDNNFLNGTIPSSVGDLKMLTYLDLNDNKLTGTIPSSLGNLPFILAIYLNNNQLFGTIPSSLGNLQTMYSLGLFNNRLNGSIPNSFGNLSLLQNLYLSQNILSGTIPSSISQLKLFRKLFLNSNYFTGSIPPSIGNLKYLIDLVLCNNSLTGYLPTSLGNLQNLENIVLYSNNFRGTIPPAIGSLSNIIRLQLQDNAFSGPFFNIFNTNKSIYRLEILNVANNVFTGSISLDFTKFPRLTSINAVSNCFAGTLPSSICSLSNTVESLILDIAGGNLLCHENRVLNIPRVFNTKSSYSNLGLGSSIPSCLFSMPNLNELRLSGKLFKELKISKLNIHLGNQFVGTIPDLNYDDISALTVLSLNDNKLTGTIPLSIQEHEFSILDLSNNRLHGTLSSSFVVAPNQLGLGLAVNRITGELPSSLTNQNDGLNSINKLNILATNMFTCSSSQIPKSDINSKVYSCGSLYLNITYGFFGVSVGILILIFLLLYFSPENSGYTMFVYFASIRNKTNKWLTKAWRTDSSNELKGFLVSFLFLRNFSLIVTFLGMAVLLPLYLGLNLSDLTNSSIVSYQYGYVVTISFLHGNGIVIFMAILLFIVLMGFRLSVTVFSTIFSEFFDQIKQPTIIHSDSIWYTIGVIMIIFFYHLINLVVTVTVNAVYVNSNLNYNQVDNQYAFTALQIAISFFKTGWNATYVPFAVKKLRKFTTTSSAMQSRYVMSIINFIVAPCIATIAVNQSCFYYVFNRPNAISIPYSEIQIDCVEVLSNKKILAFLDTVNCNFESVSTTLPPAYPPYHYTYACGSALLISYIPILIYVYVIIGVAIPITRISFAWLQCVPRMYTFRWFRGLFTGVHPDHVRGPNILVDVMIHMTVLLTFGLAAPFLCLEIAMVLSVIWIVSLSLIGRISNSNQSVDHTSSPIHLELDINASTTNMNSRQQVMEGLDIVNSWRSVLVCADWAVLTVVSFWAYLFFDMVADRSTWIRGVVCSGIFGIVTLISSIGINQAIEYKYIWISWFSKLKENGMQIFSFNDLSFEPCSRQDANCIPSDSINDDEL